MTKIIFIVLFLSLANICCQNNIIKENPAWLKYRINSLLDNQNDFGAVIFRYKWNNMYVYHVQIPISSCAYCELYDQDGKKIIFSSDSLRYDFLKKKSDNTFESGTINALADEKLQRYAGDWKKFESRN